MKKKVKTTKLKFINPSLNSPIDNEGNKII